MVSAALGTPLEWVQAPGQSGRAIVNTASPQVPAALDGVVTGVVGLDGLFREHDMLKRGHTAAAPAAAAGAAATTPGTTESPEVEPEPAPATATTPSPAAHSNSNAVVAHAGTPQACSGAQGVAVGGTYTSTQLSSVFGLDQLFAQGRTGIGQTIAVVEFEQYAASDFAAFQACYGLSNPIRNVPVDGGVGGPAQGSGEAALRAPGRLPRPLRLPRRRPGARMATPPRRSTSSTRSQATTAPRS